MYRAILLGLALSACRKDSGSPPLPAGAPAPSSLPTLVRPVTDEASVLDPDDEAALDRQIREIRDETGVQMAVLTVAGLPPGASIEGFSLEVARRWEGGSAERDDGLLVVLAIADRRSRIEVGTGLGGYVTDAEARRLLDAAAPALRAGDYGGALSSVVDGLGAEVASLQPGEPIPAGRRLLGWALGLLPSGATLTALYALAGGALATALGWGFWAMGPLQGPARWLARRYRPFLAVSLLSCLVALALTALVLGGSAGARALGGLVVGGVTFGPLGASNSRKQLWAGAIAGLGATALAWVISWLATDAEFGAWGLYPTSSILVAFFALEGGMWGEGGGGSGRGRLHRGYPHDHYGHDHHHHHHHDTTDHSSSSSSSSSSDWSGGGGDFGGGGGSGSW